MSAAMYTQYKTNELHWIQRSLAHLLEPGLYVFQLECQVVSQLSSAVLIVFPTLFAIQLSTSKPDILGRVPSSLILTTFKK